MRTLGFIFGMGEIAALLSYLAAFAVGLLLLIALLVVIRLLLGSARARRRRAHEQGETRSDGGSQEVQRRVDQVKEPLAASNAPVFPAVEKEIYRGTSRFRSVPRDSHIKLEVASLSHPGIKRQYKPNEDSLFALQGMRFQGNRPQSFALFVVADGLGGHLYGKEASQLGIQMMIDRVLPALSGNCELKETDFRQLLIEGVGVANQTIHQRNKAQCTTMGTTITASLVIDETAFVANVGDSRTYLYRVAEGLRQITRDHSVVAYLVEQGIIQNDAIYTHPLRNQVYRSLGTEAALAVDTFIEPLRSGDTLLLCSDGLWEMVHDPLIEQILRDGTDASQTSQALLQAALVGGGADNISVIVVRVGETTRCRDTADLHLLAIPDAIELPRAIQNRLRQSS